jgi:hypothetical protein
MQIWFGAILIGAGDAATGGAGADARAPTGADAGGGGHQPAIAERRDRLSIASEIKNPRDLKLNHTGPSAANRSDAIGPIKDRGELTGVIIHKGVLVAEWGELRRADMTHSVTKACCRAWSASPTTAA